MRNVDALVTEAGNALRPLLLEAFEAGRTEGRQQALKTLKSKISSIWEEEAVADDVGGLSLRSALLAVRSGEDQRKAAEPTEPSGEAKSA